MGDYSENSRKLAHYIYGDLEPGEVTKIEQEISQDTDLAESYRMNVKVRNYLRAKVQLEEMRNDPDLEEAMAWAETVTTPVNEKQSPVRYLRRPLLFAAALAASLALFLGLRSWMPQDPGKLYYSYYQPFEASDFTRRGDEEEKYREISDAIRSYLSGNYPETVRLFSLLSSNPRVMPEVYLYKGLSYMGLGMFESAEVELQNCLDDGTRYRPESLWHLSLCKLKLEKYDEARELLEELDDYAGIYGRNAQELGKKIRRITR